MLPTVHLWCIIQAWQPFNRVLKLEEEVSLGGYTKAQRLRGPLQLSDHTPIHTALPTPLPRQIIFRPSEGAQFRGCIVVREPWLVSLPDLFDDNGAPIPLKSRQEEAQPPASLAIKALSEVLAYMQSTKTSHAILTTYQHFVFLRAHLDASGSLSSVQVSPPVAAQDHNVTVYAALWYFCRDIAPRE